MQAPQPHIGFKSFHPALALLIFLLLANVLTPPPQDEVIDSSRDSDHKQGPFCSLVNRALEHRTNCVQQGLFADGFAKKPPEPHPLCTAGIKLHLPLLFLAGPGAAEDNWDRLVGFIQPQSSAK